MTGTRRVVQSGGFVDAGSGTRFRLVSEPSDLQPRGSIVFVPPFAEEMNKSRRMVARTARALAADGWRVIQRDLQGCGDSSGEFGDASWAAWVADVEAELSRAPAGLPVWLWCLRGGALLAPAALAAHPGVNLLLWQPVLSGAQHLQQFLRLHAGARIVSSGTDSDTAAPAQTLRAGKSVEVGGYQISPALARGMEQAVFELPPDFGGSVEWFELSTQDPPELSPQATRMVERLRHRGLVVEPDVLGGPPFWLTQEIEECEPLLVRSLARLRADGTGASRAATRHD